MRLRLGTRGSELARAQSGHVADALRALGHEVELVTIRSAGDAAPGSLVEAGGLGVFAAALRRALLAGEVDLAVHSLKDLPTAPVPGLVLAAIPSREDPSDALCAREQHTLAGLPAGSRVGTGSPRRAAQVRRRRPDLTVVEIRGNVGTRLARLEADLDAVVLARAGLARLGRLDAVTDTLDLLPAPGQGALAVECRADDDATRDAVAPLDDGATRTAVTAERSLLATLEAGCAAPVGALAVVGGGRIELTAVVLGVDGADAVTARRSVPLAPPPDAAALGRAVAGELLAAGAAGITSLGAARDSRLAEFHDQVLWAPGSHPALVGRRVLLPRPDGPLADALRATGAVVDAVPLTAVHPLPFDPPAHADWLVLTSATGVAVLRDAGLAPADLADRVAAVGPATAAALADAGVRVELVPDPPGDARALVAAFPPGPGRVLAAGSALAAPTLADGLAALGWQVTRLATYTTGILASTPPGLAAAWPAYDAVVLTAGSVARAVTDLLGPPAGHTRVVALGGPSADAARAAGLVVHATATTPDAAGLVAALVAALQEQP